VLAELRTIDLKTVRIPDVRVSSILNPEQQALLSSTIQAVGTVQDIVVREIGESKYELVAGKSRLQDILAKGYTEWPVKVITATEKLALIMNIVENLARGTYEYISVSQAIRKLRNMGASWEELEGIFPWKHRWLEFIDGLQDLPDDVVEALRARKITPTHVQVALNLPTPVEVHGGLRTAITHEWDTGIFKTFVQNRVDQIADAHREAAAKGLPPEIPPPLPEQLIKYKMCLVCGYRKPAEEITVQLICDGCRQLAKYVKDVVGPNEDAMQVVYRAMQAYHGVLQQQQRPRPPPAGE